MVISFKSWIDCFSVKKMVLEDDIYILNRYFPQKTELQKQKQVGLNHACEDCNNIQH